MGAGGRIFHGNEQDEWEESLHGATSNTLYDVWGTRPDDVFAVGDAETILHYDGSTWTLVQVPPSIAAAPELPDLHGVWGDVQSVYFSGSKSTVLKLIRSAP